jgi:hypothetical protein
MLSNFMELRCQNTSEVRTFLGQLHVKREELAAVGITLTNKDYQSAILKSLPKEMSKFVSNLLTGARLFSSGKTIDPDTLIDHISKEADRLCTRRK